MAVFTIQAPDGRKIKVEAPDEATALRGAQEWAAANPASSGQSEAIPPDGLVPGSPAYAKWAAEQARAGKKLPQVGKHTDAPNRPDGLMDKAFAAAGSFIEGVPIAGPTLIEGAKQARAAVQGMSPLAVDTEFAAAKEANPISSTVGSVGGAVGALAPLGATSVGGRLLGMTGSLPARIATGATSGAVISGADTLARGGDMQDAGTSATIGGAIGGALPIVGAGVRRAISPVAGNSTKARAADVLRREGVEVTAGQRTGSQGLKYRESEIGGAAADALVERQADQFTSAALRRAGIDATRATTDVVDGGFARIGQMFDDLSANNDMLLDTKLGDDIANAVLKFRSVTAQSQRAPIVDDIARDLYNLRHQTVGGGPPQSLAGSAYKDLRTRIEDARRATSDSGLQNVLMEMRNALDEAAERWISIYNPQALGQWQQARRLYRNMLVIEDAVTRAGEKAADGIITPANLRSAALRQSKRGYARGRGDFTELANAGVSAMTPLPNSGTAGRLNARSIMPIGMATGAGIGGTIGGVPGALVGGAVGAAVPWATGRAMLSGPGRAYLGNQLANRIPSMLPPAGAGAAVNQQRMLPNF